MTEQTIFLAALDISDRAARTAYLDQACGQDAALRRQVEALLTAHDRSGFLEQPALEQIAAGRPGERPTVTVDPNAPSGPDTPTLASPGAAAGRDDDLSFLKPPTRADAIGRLDRYEVLEVLGRGGFGTVLRAFDERLHRVVAIKVLAPQLAASGPARARFEREARAGAAVRDEHVVNIYEVSPPDTPVPYLVMEYVAGQTLQQKLDRTGPLSVPEVLRIGSQVAKGLAAAHATGLIHRDIKPSNILLENGVERVKLTDFGLARAADDASISHSGMVAGTPQYMAPEQAHGEKIDHRADLFSLGSVLYAMCTGRPPFRASTTMAVLKRVCEEDPRPVREINPEVPDWLAAVIARLHAKKPQDRFQSAKEVAELLQQHLAHLQQPSLVARPPAVVPPPPSPRRWQAGDRVLAPWEPEWLYPATIQQTAADSVQVAYDDGDSDWVDAAAVRPLDIEPGARVFGWWNGPYYPGTVTARDGDRVHIDYDDGDSEWTELSYVRIEHASGLPSGSREASAGAADRNSQDVRSAKLRSALAAAAERSAGAAPPDRPLPPAIRRLRLPANGLFVTGILYWAALPVVFVLRFVPGISEEAFRPLLLSLGVVPVIAGFVFVLAAWKMKRGELYPLCVAAALLPLALVGEKLFSLVRGSLTIVPGDFTALPFGIWALIVLTRTDVRAAFARVRAESPLPTRPPARRLRWVVAATVLVLLALAAVWFGHPALLYVSDEGELELEPADGLTSVIVLQNPEGVIDGNKLHPAVTDWLSMKTGHTLKVPPGKYQLNAGTWPEGIRFIHWRATTSGPSGSSTLLLPAYGSEGWSTIVTVERGRRTTVHPVAIPTPPADAAPRKESTRDSDGFVPLFNGKDLAGWKTHPDQPGDWRVEDGLLVGRGPKKSHLFTERGDFTDFRLRVEARLEPGGNSGVCFRSDFKLARLGDTPDLLLPPGYEADISDSPKQVAKTGTLWRTDRGPVAVVKEPPVPPDTWFTLDVVAVGPRITVKVNGQTTADWMDDRADRRSGHIALQVNWPNSTVVRFRKVEIKELPPAPPGPAVQALRDAVAAKERSRDMVKTRYDAGAVSLLDLTLAEIELTEVRIRLAEAEGDRAAVAARLQDLVTHWETQRDLTEQLVQAGRSARDVLSEAEARLGAAKARLAQAGGAPPAGPQPVKLRSFTPGKDPLPVPHRGPATAVTAVGDAWRIENTTSAGNFNVMVAQAIDNLPKDGVLIFRAKVKVEAKVRDEALWGDLGFGSAKEVYPAWDQWPQVRARYADYVTDWTEKEARYPVAEVLKKGPTVYLYAGLHANGVLWLKDVELLHLPAAPTDPPLAIAPFDEKKAKDLQEAWARHLGVPVEKTNSIGMKLRLIPPGEFTMGSSEQEVEAVRKQVAAWAIPAVEAESPPRKVTIRRAYYLGTKEVTVGQFRQFVTKTLYRTEAEKSGKGGRALVAGDRIEQKSDWVWTQGPWAIDDDRPVVQVTLDDAKAFCKWLSAAEGVTYALPTEEQWEFACRAGTTTYWPTGNDPDGVVETDWVVGSSNSDLHRAGRKRANPFGLYDMLGNAEELCDWEKDGQQLSRGGHANLEPWLCRSVSRWTFKAGEPYYRRGFRVAVVGDLKPKAPAAPKDRSGGKD